MAAWGVVSGGLTGSAPALLSAWLLAAAGLLTLLLRKDKFGGNVVTPKTLFFVLSSFFCAHVFIFFAYMVI